MQIIKTDYLTDDMSDSLTDLVLDVNEADKAKYAVPDDADYFVLCYDDKNGEVTVPEETDAELLDPDGLMGVIAIYEMGETYNDKTVIELSAFTSPASRRNGVFTALFKSICEELSGFSVRFAVYEDDINKAVLKAVGAVFDHNEVMMALDTGAFVPGIYDASEYDVQSDEVHTEDGDFEEGFVSSKYGECSYRVYGDEAYVYGILTYESFLRKGCAYRMLSFLFDTLKVRGIKEVTLEVSGSNAEAVGLYKKLGFETVDSLAYYYCAV